MKNLSYWYNTTSSLSSTIIILTPLALNSISRDIVILIFQIDKFLHFKHAFINLVIDDIK